MSDQTDYYEILGVEADADNAELRKVYRKMVKKYHPDENENREEAEKKLKEINKAYEALSNPQKREKYDKIRNYTPKNSGAPNNKNDSTSHNSGNFEKSQSKKNIPCRGADIKTTLEITFDEACFGVKKNVMTSTIENCKTCMDKDEITKKFCSTCYGERRIRRSRRFEVNIPPGIDDGHIIRLSKKGELGKHGGENGDLLIKVSVQKGKARNLNKTHNVKEAPRRGSDIKGSMEITFEQSYKGTRQNITLLTTESCHKCKDKDIASKKFCVTCYGKGKIQRSKSFEINVPAGIADGHIIRLSKKGASSEHGGENGDVLIDISVQKHAIFERHGNDVYLDVPIDFIKSRFGGEIEVPTLDGSVIKYIVEPKVKPEKEVHIKGKGFPSVKNDGIFGDLIFKLTRKIN